MIWNTTSDERQLATAWPAPGDWNDWRQADLDGFGLPLIGSWLGMLPDADDAPDAFLDPLNSDPPRKG